MPGPAKQYLLLITLKCYLQNDPLLRHSNRYGSDSACVHCDGVIRHKFWCATQSANVHYAFRAVLDPSQLTLGDELILHALGVAWAAERKSGQPGQGRERGTQDGSAPEAQLSTF